MKQLHILSACFLAVILTACMGNPPESSPQTVTLSANAAARETQPSTGPEETLKAAESEEKAMDSEDAMLIQVQGNGHTIVFELNGSAASRSLYSQLPLNTEVEDFSDNEKIFYPPAQLEVGDTPLTKGGEQGGLAYFASWGDVIMYYGSYGPYNGLYDLGTAISGSEWIQELSGEILLERAGTKHESAAPGIPAQG